MSESDETSGHNSQDLAALAGWYHGAKRRGELSIDEYAARLEEWVDDALKVFETHEKTLAALEERTAETKLRMEQLEQTKNYAPDCEQVWNALMADVAMWHDGEALEAKIQFAMTMTALGIRPSGKPQGLE